MQYYLQDAQAQPTVTINKFLGLNRLEKAETNEFCDMVNMTSDRFPCLAPAKKWHKIKTVSGDIRAVIAPKYQDGELDTFTGVIGNTFYYKDTAKTGTIPDGDITMIDFNGTIVMCIYDGSKSTMLCYDYTKDDSTVRDMEKGIKNVKLTVSGSGNPDTDAYVANYIEYTGGWDGFEVGDSVFVEGFSSDKNNTVLLDSRYQSVDKNRAISCIVEKISGTRMYVQLYNNLNEPLVFIKETSSRASVYTKMPTMNHICVHNNRLWGTNPNGEYVYASKLGDCFNFNVFQGLANDSYYAQIGTRGGFVGIVSYRDNLVALKRDYIHHIYGDKPSNFSIPKQLGDCGCTDIRSAVQIGTALYFLGYGGFYVYSGGQPELISQKLDRKYKSAVAMTDGEKYIVSCVTKDGTGEVLVFDTVRGLWHKEEYKDVIGSFKWHDDIYAATNDSVFKYGSLSPDEWECTSSVIYENIFDNKGMTELWIRAKVDEGASVTVYTSEDGGEWLERTTLSPCGLKVYRIPIRFITGEFYQYKLVGKGNAVIYDIERHISGGGRQYR